MQIKLKIIEGSQNFIKYTNNQIKFERVDNLYGNPFFLEYHKKIKCFYLVVELNQKIVSYLPFTKENNSILSHGGGTYGGFIQINDLSIDELCEIENELLKFLKLNGIDRLKIRFLPTLFWNNPSSLNSYFFSKMESLFTEEEFYLPLGENLDSMENLNFRRNHKRDIKKFLQNEFELISCNLEKDVSAFYEILENNLTPQVEMQDGSLDIKTDRALSYSIHVNLGFAAIEEIFDNAMTAYPDSVWYYGNVYDPTDGVTPLNWWDSFINQV